MKQYIGSKTIGAEPMTLGDYNTLRGWTIPANEDPKKEGYKVEYPDGYISWSPKEIFEEAYSELIVGINATSDTLLKVSVFPSNILSIGVAPDPDYGGAHQYQFQNSLGFSEGQAKYDQSFQKIQFVQKNVDGTMKPGLQTEQLLLAIIDRHMKLNNKFPSEDGLMFIRKIEEALVHLEDRVKERMDRGVMGDLKK